jgi:hypothetical protein
MIIMKKLLFASLVVMLMGCTSQPVQPAAQETPNPNTRVKITLLSPEMVEQGLSMVKVNDTLTVLIYRGVESCSMIKLE